MKNSLQGMVVRKGSAILFFRTSEDKHPYKTESYPTESSCKKEYSRLNCTKRGAKHFMVHPQAMKYGF